MELNEILSALENISRKFPHLAVEQAIAQQEAITPLLLKALEEAKTNIEEIDENPAYYLHIFALYLLAQFREPRACPLVVDFFSIPGEITLDLTGDLVTEHLGRILASVYNGDLNLIKQLIEDPEVNEYVRGSAVTSLLILVLQGVIAREEMIQYFQELFSTPEKDESYFWTDLAYESAKLCPTEELLQLIEQTSEAGIVDSSVIQRDRVDHYLELGPEGALNELREDPNYTLVEDTVAEMEWWACFQEEKPKSTSKIPRSLKGLVDFPQSSKNKAQKKKKRQAQKQSRKKNRSKKK